VVRECTEYVEAERLTGEGSPDLGLVKRLLQEGAEKGCPSASYALATWFLHGKENVVRQNRAKALKLLKFASYNGHPAACYDIAVSYETGIGIRQSLSRAFEYYTKAALLGDSQSFYEVGRMYYYGIGVKRDRRLSDVWMAFADKVVE
jgi:uncharacterized protein